MPRRREVPKREILPDPKFGSQDVSKFINVIMQAGKKSVAERIVYGAFAQISGKAGKVLVGCCQRQAGCRSQKSPRRRCELPGAGRGASVAPHGPVDALAA